MSTKVGLAAGLPSGAGPAGYRYVARDTNQEWVSDGVEWILVGASAAIAALDTRIDALEAASTVRHIVARYDFDVQGGTIGEHVLTDVFGNDIAIAADEVVIGGALHVKEPLTSGGAAQVALGISGSGDGEGFASLDVITGFLDLEQQGPQGTWPYAAVEWIGSPAITIADFALTGGVLEMHFLVASATA